MFPYLQARTVDASAVSAWKQRVIVQQNSSSDFEQVMLPHLDDAYALARWLARNEQDAKDIVQEACLRALHYYGRFHGGDFRPWLLKIVRNTFHTWRLRNGTPQSTELTEGVLAAQSGSRSPEDLAIANNEALQLREALRALTPDVRQLVILRELEGFSYREISSIAGVPLGTVMSGLSRGRTRLRKAILEGICVASVQSG